jgi:hypothetical protein
VFKYPMLPSLVSQNRKMAGSGDVRIKVLSHVLYVRSSVLAVSVGGWR